MNKEIKDPLKEIPPIGLERLCKTFPAAFSSFYITLMAMIQSVALGLLVYTSTTVLADTVKSGSLVQSVELFGYAFITAGIIAIIWHEYVLATIEIWWPIDWLDTFIPLLLGIGQYTMIAFLEKDLIAGWYGSLVITSIAALVAYLNLGKTKREYFEEEIRNEAYAHYEKCRKRGVKLYSVYIFIFTGLTCLYFFFSQWVLLRISFLALTICLLFIIIKRRNEWWKGALKIYGWEK